ncbi:bacterio-opsin activator domain-containing protein [Haloarcula salina]|uniref:PAS domain S-box protein n=1 Tax=Haloarcula salina TaxID=1429914 RepID=A0AA41FYQ0_9EURY|nr:bacterio-opsin activator domain-containing protein [Haloarcula salina]MBV0900439.1 PAS domain S-box protein [Haloarcula salina]
MTESDSPIASSSVLLAGTTDWLARLAERIESHADATARTAETATEAIDAVTDGPVDCVVTALAVGETTGIELAERIRTEAPSVPVLLGTADGNETVASDATAAGVSDYVVVDDPPEQAVDTVLRRLERALDAAQQERVKHRRARQFDAVFRDTQTATWVLDPDGTLVRVNQTACEMIDGDAESVLGEPFWSLPWWSQTESTQQEIRQLVAETQDGTSGSSVIFDPTNGGSERVIDLSVRSVEDEHGELTSIVVRGVEITERVSLERDLRRSEELHRVTLNNMTDTVLITDEDGEYTYVCPNVHFIFGYTADEIRTRETIDDLLGEDLFDRDELAETGSLKNIECTATDKAGREHTLLVNVREVDIQGGKLLYSCRDITKRKQREEALATLQELARGFLYAGTHDEIAQHIVEDSPSVLDLDATAVYLFDADTNELRPATHSQAMRSLHGPLPRVHADGETLPGYGFIEGRTLFFDDVHEAERLDNRATDLRSAGYIPLGDHGVFVVGSSTVAAFDDVTRELADLLAATAEAALDRVTRESRLREQDRQLQTQNEQLSALNRINETIRAIDRAIVQAETRDEIDHAASELLASDDRFSFAWVGRVDTATDTLEPRAWAGDEQGYLDSREFAVDASGTEPAGRTAATGEVTMVPNVATDLREDSWRGGALTRDFLSVLSIPLEYNDLSHGVLTVYADTRDAFDETARAVLAELGETIASALSAIERKNALLTTSVTRVAFEIDDRSFILSRLARDADCTLSYQGGMQHTTDGSYVFVTVDDAPIEAVESAAAELAGIDDVQPISDASGGGVLRLGLTRPFLALELADHGAVFREATADGTSATLTIDVPDSIEVRNITRLVDEAFSGVDLRSKRTLDQAAETDIYERFLSALTDRQLEVVQTAYYSGFFESPRENTGEEVASMLDISPPAFYQHVRTVQRKLFTTLFEERNPSVTASR